MSKPIEDVLEGKAIRIVYSSDKELIVECLKTMAEEVVAALYYEQWDWHCTHTAVDQNNCFVTFKATPVRSYRAG